MKNDYSFEKNRKWREVKKRMGAIHQLVDEKPRCGAELDPPRPPGAYTMYPCRDCRIRELEDALRPFANPTHWEQHGRAVFEMDGPEIMGARDAMAGSGVR